MSDLVRRQEVIDVLKQTGIIQDNDLGHLVVDEINRIPIAYSVEKVEKNLRLTCYAMGLEEHEADVLVRVVRKGGVE